MNKAKGMKKCTPLFGEYILRNNIYVESLNEEIERATDQFKTRMIELTNRPARTEKQRSKIKKLVSSEMSRVEKKMIKLQDRISYWEDSPDSYTFIFESLN
jgi:septal ring factor EnvC (AmiA/AmiB activator)